MKPVFRYSVMILLSLLAAWLGIVLGRPAPNDSATDPSSPHQPTRPRPGVQMTADAPDPSIKLTEEQRLRQIIARCETGALWDWLRSESNFNRLYADAVIDELIDRLGMGAWDEAMAFGDPAQQEKISALVLEGLSRKDVWQALEIYQKNRSRFHEEWGDIVAANAVSAAGKSSADQLIGVLDQSTSSKAKLIMTTEYPPGFDFKKLADHLENSATRSICAPEAVLSTWASRDPLAAAEWLAAHPTPAIGDEAYRPNNIDTIAQSFQNILDSTHDSREAALKKFAELPQPVLQQVWQETTKPAIDPTMLAVADQMGQRETFLIESLLKTHRAWNVDPSWQSIPTSERLQILDAAEQQWAEKSSSPIDQRARQHWRKMVTDSWNH